MFRIDNEKFFDDNVGYVISGRRPPHQNPTPKPPRKPKPPKFSRRKANKGLGSKQLEGRKKQGNLKRVQLGSHNKLVRVGKIRKIRNVKKLG